MQVPQQFTYLFKVFKISITLIVNKLLKTLYLKTDASHKIWDSTHKKIMILHLIQVFNMNGLVPAFQISPFYINVVCFLPEKENGYLF